MDSDALTAMALMLLLAIALAPNLPEDSDED